MAYSVSTKPAVDGTGAAIPGGVVFVDESGLGTGPYIIGKTTIDPAGVNAQGVLANGAAKSDLSSVNGVNLGSPSAYGTPPGAVNVPGVNAFITNTVGVSGTITANQGGAWTVQQGGAPWSVSQSGAWTVTCNAGLGTFTVSGTVAATQSGAWTVGQSGSWTVTANQGAPPWSVSQSGTWTVQQGTPPWSVSQSGTWSVGQAGNWTSRIVGNAGGIMDAAGQNAASPANELLVAGQYNLTPTAITSGNVSPLQLDANGNLKVNIAVSSGSTTVSGTVTANQGGAPWADNLTQLNGVALGSPSAYGTAPGAVNVPGVNAFVTNTVGVSGTVTANAGTGTFAVSGTVTANQGGAPWSVNNTQINGSAIVTAATGVQKVGVTGNAGAAFDAAIGATAPANALQTGGLAMTTLPTAVSAGQIPAIAVDKFGRQVTLPQTTRDNIGMQTTTISTTTETTVVTAGAAGVFNDLMMLIVSNTAASGSDTRIDFRQATAGTVVFSLMSRGGQQPVGFSMGGPAIPQATAAANWTAQLASAVTDIRIFAVFAKNK